MVNIGATAPLTRRMSHRVSVRPILLLGLPAAIVVVLFYVPLVAFLTLGIRTDSGALTLAYLHNLIGNSVYVSGVIYSVMFSAVTALASLALGYPVAYALAHSTGKKRLILLTMIVVPLFTSGLIRSYAWVAILNHQGVVNSLLSALGFGRHQLLYTSGGLFVAMLNVDLPFMILPLFGVMQGIDKRYEQAAATLGGGPVRRFVSIYFPLSLPGVLAGSILVFALTIGSFVTPQLIGSSSHMMVAVLINFEISSVLDWHNGAALSILLVAACVGALVVQARAAKFEL